MSFDLAIWKRSELTKTAMLAEAYDAICDGVDHPAITTFNLPALEEALKAEFGDYQKVDSTINCESGTTVAANWLIVHCSHSEAQSIAARIVPIALGQGLLVYDPQSRSVWGNKRPAKKM